MTDEEIDVLFESGIRQLCLSQVGWIGTLDCPHCRADELRKLLGAIDEIVVGITGVLDAAEQEAAESKEEHHATDSFDSNSDEFTWTRK